MLGNAARPSDQLSRWIPQPSLHERIGAHELFISYSSVRAAECRVEKRFNRVVVARSHTRELHSHDH